MTKWNVVVGDIEDAISSDLLEALDYAIPYRGDTRARYGRLDVKFSLDLASAYAAGLRGDAAALEAIRRKEERRAAHTLETARQKVAEIEARAAADNRAAAAMNLAAKRER